MLSLAERGQSSILFCKDNELGQGASGNRQGAIYPLLTPENDELSRFFQQAFLFSRRRIEALSHASKMETNATPHVTAISHDFCGVLQTGHDERSQQRLDKIIQSQDWPAEIAYAVDANAANERAQIGIDKAGFFYPLGGWVCPFEYAKAAVDKASQLADVQCHFNTEITEIECDAQAWYLHSQGQRFGPFSQLVLANGAQLTQFSASERLQISPFRGQVSHVPAQFKLSQLATVLCANGYLTPSHQGLHCLGASYVKAAEHLDFCPQEQLENLGKMQQSYPNQAWVDDIDISGNSARVGVRMVTRDHFPMMGCAPNVAEILARYEQHQLNQQHAEQSKHYWQTTPAPILDGLYILGGLGSRGLSSGPLAAECLAAQLTGEPLPLDWPTLNKLNPNRMWLRKLLKGKAL
jgi:tRNA 5-methylaminomethyl-2-thiouridine biosynthesis bifunctional protein